MEGVGSPVEEDVEDVGSTGLVTINNDLDTYLRWIILIGAAFTKVFVSNDIIDDKYYLKES